MMTTVSKAELSERLLRWVIAAVHPQASVVSISRLHGLRRAANQ